MIAHHASDVRVQPLRGVQLDTVVSRSQGKGIGPRFGFADSFVWRGKATISMMTAFNVAYEVKDQRGSIIWTLTSFAVALGRILLVFVVIGSGALAAFAGTLVLWFPGALLVLIRLVTYALLAIIVIPGVSLLFRFGPYRPRARFHWATPGTVNATVVWLLTSSAFSIYVANIVDYGATYGSLSAIIVALTLVVAERLLITFGSSALRTGLSRKKHARSTL